VFGDIPGGRQIVGRYLGFKRVPLLVRAYARARPRFETPVPLSIWGGSPGEWEGEHPYTVARELAVDGVFFSGWRGHDELPLRPRARASVAFSAECNMLVGRPRRGDPDSIGTSSRGDLQQDPGDVLGRGSGGYKGRGLVPIHVGSRHLIRVLEAEARKLERAPLNRQVI